MEMKEERRFEWRARVKFARRRSVKGGERSRRKEEKKKEGLETVSATGCRNGALVRIKTAGHC